MQKDQVETETEEEKDTEHHQKVKSKTGVHSSTNCIPLPFPSRWTRSKKKE